MGVFYLPRELLEDVRAHAAEAAPDECVGLLLGCSARVDRVLRLTNVSPTPQTRFFADPQALFTALQEADRRGEQLLGSYHSHPQTDALPSLSDLAGAQGKTVQLIVGRDTVRVFRLYGGVATELELKLL